MSKISYSTIADDTLVDIKVSGAFHKTLVNLLARQGESVSLEEFQKVLNKIKNNEEPDSLFEYTIHIILMLIYEVEFEAKKQNKITLAEVEDLESSDNSPQPNPQA